LAQQNGTIISLEELSKQVDADISRLKDLVTQMPEIVTEYARLKREYEVVRSNLEALTGRREAARFAEEVDTKTEQVQFRIVEPPNTPVTPQGPNRPVLRAGVLAGGLGAGAAFCLLLALIAGTYTNAQRLQEIFQRPVIGVISRINMPSARRLQALELTCFTLVCSGLVGVFYLVLLGAVKALPDIMIQRLMSI
jgi:hypothetical protein